MNIALSPLPGALEPLVRATAPLAQRVAMRRLGVLARLLLLWCAMGCVAGAAWAQSAAATDSSPSSGGGPIRLRQPANADDAGATRDGAAARTLPAAPQPPTEAAPPEPLRREGDARRLPARPAEFEAFTRLPRFGADMVASLASGAPDFSPVVPPDYLVQTGDELLVNIWGSVDADLRLVVDRSGRITIPRVGPVTVAGSRLADLPEALTRRASQVFRNFELGVSLGRLRGVRVYVTGFVQRPGAYVLSSLSTAMNAVMRAGGPSEAGSFRSIELRRDGRTAAQLDLYDLLLRGDRGGDKVLQPDDVVHVAAVGPQVAVRGSVNQQAIYEIKPGEKVGDALRMAGGFNAVADRSRVSIERLGDRHGLRVVDHPLPASESLALLNGDVVRAYSAVEASLSVQRTNKRVKVEGEVARPGEYVLGADATIGEAVRAAGGLTSAAYVRGTQFLRESVRLTQQENYDRALRDFEIQVTRANGTQRIASQDEAANQSAAMAANTRLLEQLRALKPTGRIVLQLPTGATELPNLSLEDGDRLLIPAWPTTVGIFGSVFSSGSYLYAHGRSVGEYLQLAGGPTRGADESSVFVVRADGTVNSAPRATGLFSRAGVPIAGLATEPGDTIFVPEELNKSTLVQSTKDWTQILYQFGLGVAGIKSALGW